MQWVNTGEDGQYATFDNTGSLKLENLATGSSRVLVTPDAVPEDASDYWLKPDVSKVLFATNYTKQYRHSYFANYFVYDLATKTRTPIAADQQGDIQYAVWNPVSDSIAYVRNNNLFIWTANKTTQITKDGSPDMFNGVPDWVYEEEILGDRSAIWWSPDGKSLAYLSFNETGVPTYTVPYYMCRRRTAPAYPCDLKIRYPKVSETNPTVSFNLLDFDTLVSKKVATDAFKPNDLIIGEVAWLTDKHSHVIFRAFNRVQDYEKLVLVDTSSGKASIVRERDGSDGWLDNNLAISYVGNVGLSKRQTGFNSTYYVDLSDESGWTHLYLYPTTGGKPIPLTSGQWEVEKILKVDKARGVVYYSSTEHHSTERHVFSVSLRNITKKALVDATVPAVWDASFSAGGSYYILNYQGPDVPYSELYSINSTTPIKTLADNKGLYQLLQTYKLPKVSWLELDHPSGFKLNAELRLPANFDPNKKYPVLFTPYGGPGSQEVQKTIPTRGWAAYIASDPELEYITFTVDNRGTGYRGRAFRSTVAKQLGNLEAEDQVWAAREIAKYPYVDKNKIVIWGWSYGGYLSAKVLETNSGAFSMGLITAPVSDWRLYDSMYTERFMKTYEMNAAGYNKTAVRKVDGFKNVAGGFLIQHGTGDDNVHFQNSATLVDTLISGGVSPEKMQVQFFTDSK